MDRFKRESEVVYDANIIIFYCFLYKNHRIVEKTNKARKLTQYLVNNGIEIKVPEFIIHEINNKGFPKIVDDYLNDKKNVIVDVSRNPPHGLTLRLVQKLQNNFKNLQKKDYFHIEEYEPEEKLFDSIKSFFMNFNDKAKLDEFYDLKHVEELSPSDEDMKLILFAMERTAPLISDDWDVTFFREELSQKNLAHEIINFKEIGFVN
ncbi:hypothetical protein [Methanobrevibacter sp.]